MMRRRTVLLISADDCGWTDLRAALANMAEVQLAGEVRSEHRVRDLATTVMPAPEVVIAAARIEGTSTLPLLTAIRREYWPMTRLLIFATHFESDELVAFAALGVRGYLLWNDLSPETLRHCLAAVLTRDLVISSGAVATAFVDAQRRHVQCGVGTPTGPSSIEAILRPHQSGLSPQEWNVLQLLSDPNLSPAAIGAMLHIEGDSVRTYMKRIAAKWGVSGGRAAILVAARVRGLLPGSTVATLPTGDALIPPPRGDIAPPRGA